MKKLIVMAALFAAAWSLQAQECIRPDYLKPGDRVAIVSPAYYMSDLEVSRAVEVLHSWGLDPVTAPNVGKSVGNVFAGTVACRSDDLIWAYSDKAVKAVFCTRGGYGAIQLLGSLPADMFTANPKWLVGFSDITTLISASICAGVMAIHGNMCNDIGSGSDPEGTETLRQMLMGVVPEYRVPAHPCNVCGHAEGMLVGGNMITYNMLSGTQYDAQALDGTILFIEEVGESYKSIDRLFNSFIVQGKAPRLRGIILGRFAKCSQDIPVASAEEVICAYASKWGIPVCCGLPAGHNGTNLPLMMGSTVTLDVTPSGSCIVFN